MNLARILQLGRVFALVTAAGLCFAAATNDWQSRPWAGVWLLAAAGLLVIAGSEKWSNSRIGASVMVALSLVAACAVALDHRG
jgi:hypothetical protein